MTRTELIACMAKETGISKNKAGDFLKALIDVLANEIQTGGNVTLTGFGTFSLKETAARKGRKPGTNEVIEIAAQKSVKFSAGKSLKDAVNEGDMDEPDAAPEEKPVKASVVEKPKKAAEDKPAGKEESEQSAESDLPNTATRFSKNWWTTYWV